MMKQPLTLQSLRARSHWGRLVLLLALVVPGLARAQSTSVVISEVYGGGGTTGATYLNDFVELYNPTAATVSLTNYSIQYNEGNGGGSYAVVPLGNVSIPANQFLLIKLGPVGSAGTALPAPDVTNALNLDASAGRLALVSNTSALGNSVAAIGGAVVDFVGYGLSANKFEGADPAPAHGGSTSTERKTRAIATATSMAASGQDFLQGNGYDSNNNNLDFVTSAAPTPQNLASEAEIFTPFVQYYNTKNPGGPLSALTTFSTTLDGSGPAPTSFATNFQIFNVGGSARTIAANWAVTGSSAKVVLLTSASFVVPATVNFTGILDLLAGSTLVQENPAPAVLFGSVAATSTVVFAQADAYTVPVLGAPGYGNLTLRNATKLLSSGTTLVRGNLLIDNVSAAAGNFFGGAAASASVLSLGGNLTLSGAVDFGLADERIALLATNTSTPQVLDGNNKTIRLFKLTLPAGQAGLALASGTTNLELGSENGGGYQLASGTTLGVNNNTLSFFPAGKATVTGGGANTGTLTLSPGSSLSFSKNNTVGFGVLRLTAGSTTLTNLVVDGAGGANAAANTLTLPTSLTVNGTLTLNSGVLAIGAGNSLTLNGPLVSGATGQLRGAPNADLFIGGTGALGTLRLPGGAQNNLRNFTLNRAGQTLALASDLLVNTAFVLTDGTLDIGPGNDLYLNGTAFSSLTGFLKGSNSSNLRIGGTGALGNLAFSPLDPQLNIFTLNRPGGTLTITGGALLIARPTLTSGVLGLGPDVALSISGPLVVADPAVALFAGTPSSLLNFTGTGAIGPLAFVPGQNQLEALTMNRSTGAVPTAPLLTDLSVNNLTLTRGCFFAQNGARLIVRPGGGLSGGGNTSYVNALTLPAVTNPITPSVSLNFPLGVDGEYRPLTFKVTDAGSGTGTASYTARQFEVPSPARALPVSLARVSQIRYYNVLREAGGSSTLQSANIRLSYLEGSDRVTAGNANLLRVAKVDPTDPGKWFNVGGQGSGSDITSDEFAASALGDFTLATDAVTPFNNNPLPVALVHFQASRQAAGVRLTWATASEKNSAYFEVQRSLDGQQFASVARVTAQGTSSQLHEYAALDAQAPGSRLYYRLRQVDLDATQAFSPVVAVDGSAAPVALTLYPNPATDRVAAALPAAEGRTYRVLNALGQVLDQGAAAGANPAVEVRRLPAGTYFLELQSATGRQVRRFVKNN